MPAGLGEGGDATKPDLLGYMLSGIDRHSGERLDDVNIRYQMNTFLIAGHETTSGMLSFAIYFLLNNPHVIQKAYEEVDRVLGRDINAKPTAQQVNQLVYIGQILKESLRLWPTAPAFGSQAPKTTRATRARTSAPAHIVHGSRVTTSVQPSSRHSPRACAASRIATTSA